MSCFCFVSADQTLSRHRQSHSFETSTTIGDGYDESRSSGTVIEESDRDRYWSAVAQATEALFATLRALSVRRWQQLPSRSRRALGLALAAALGIAGEPSAERGQSDPVYADSLFSPGSDAGVSAGKDSATKDDRTEKCGDDIATESGSAGVNRQKERRSQEKREGMYHQQRGFRVALSVVRELVTLDAKKRCH